MTTTRTSATIAFAVWLGLSAVAVAGDPSPPEFASLFGTWKAVKIIGSGNITSSDEVAKALLGRTVTISADRISNPYEPSAYCVPDNPTVTYVDTEARLEKDWDTRISDIDLPEGTLKARMPYLDAGCAEALVISPNELMWSFGNGFNYLLQRQAMH